MIRHLVPRLAAGALVLALSGCGFHLRGALVLPPDLGPVRVVSGDPYSPLAESLAQSLARAGAVAAADGATDATELRLVTERWGDTPISVDELGRSQEYSLRHAVIFELRKGDGTVVVPQQVIELSRDYISNPTRSIGTEGEREILVRELRREMAAAVLRRIDAVVRVGGAVTEGESAPVAPEMTDAAKAAIEAADATVPPTEPEPTPPRR